ncbi:MAG: sodium-independent anion transporter [Crocinitomicaceae bacterium]|nr:sodium-independent anion transporter [Crocinitomicaceae bacterium]
MIGPVRLLPHIPSSTWLRAYSKAQWRGDWPAGLTVGIMLVPQGMAYAMIAGLPVVYGLYAALVPQIVYGFFGTSRHLAVGPVAMDSLLVAAGLGGLALAGTDRYIELALLLSVMMGLTQWAMGMLRMGFLVQFLSRPVISGFTSAAAILIGLNQLPHLAGVACERSNQVHVVLGHIMEAAASTHGLTLGVGIGAIGILTGLKVWGPKVPAALTVVLGSVAVSWGMGLEAQGVQVVGHIPRGLPVAGLPSWELSDVQTLLPVALTLALVAFMEAISVAKAVEERHDYDVDANQELKALGMANVLGALFQSYPTTGGFSRTAVTEQSGGKTPVTAWVAAAVVALTLVLLTPLFHHLPNAVLAAVVLVAVVGLVDMRFPRKLWNQDKWETGVLAITFLVTLFVSLPTGIGVGVSLALALWIRQMMTPHHAVLGNVHGVHRNVARFQEAVVLPEVLVVRYDGALTFANQSHFKRTLQDWVTRKGDPLELIVIQADTISHIDASARATFRNLLQEWRAAGLEVCLAGAIGPVRDSLASDGFLDEGGVTFQLNVDDALAEFERPGSVSQRNQAMAQQHSSSGGS